MNDISPSRVADAEQMDMGALFLGGVPVRTRYVLFSGTLRASLYLFLSNLSSGGATRAPRTRGRKVRSGMSLTAVVADVHIIRCTTRESPVH